MVLRMKIPAWLMQRPKGWVHLQRVPLRQLWVLMTAALLLFSVIGFFVDLMHGGILPYASVLVNAVVGGLQAAIWILVLARLPILYAIILGVLQFFSNSLGNHVAFWMQHTFHLKLVRPSDGIHFAAYGTLVAILGSYGCFVTYIRIAGRETFRLSTELDLAHSIQKTLVPIISKRTGAFEIYGISEPSEKVGGDLVDAVLLTGGDTIAYLADIAGHGLQAGILMGMLKTAARTALLDGASSRQGGTLSMLMERLNQVLPGVKESHMYATFTALRLNLDGQAFYGMAASPPLLLWSATQGKIVRIEREQFPLALLPVSGFPAYPFSMEPGDLAVVATDGILEVCSQTGVEFGVEALETLLMTDAELPLPELAVSILKKVRAYGKQLDDQTLLLVRRHGA
jgi:serine phosphatase RsbU (regulator of sigma subunit)